MKMKRILVLHLDYQLKTLSVMIFSSLPKKRFIGAKTQIERKT